MWNRIRMLAQYPQTSLTLRDLYNLQKYRNESGMIEAGKFIKKEMAIRLARRTVELDTLKFGLAYNYHIKNTRDLYYQSTDKIMSHRKIKNMEDVVSLKNTIKDIKQSHQEVVPTMSNGILSVSDKLQPCEKEELDEFLNGFYGSRIGIRTLMGQFIGVVENKDGIIHEMKPYDIFLDAKDEVEYIAEDCYGEKPEIIFEGEKNLSITYIPSFLKYIYLEVLKNASRATIEHNLPKVEKKEIDELPPIKVKQITGKDEVIIKVSDSGGSFPRHDLNNIMSYSYTTVKKEDEERAEMNHRPIIAGLGYGVPLSKLYATYFCGDLQLIPYYDIGTDALIYINRRMDCEEKDF